jgi:hypothetical protein
VFGVFGVFYLPFYSGSAPLPLVVIAVGAALVVIPRLSYGLTRRMSAAAAPVVVWLAVTIWLYVTSNSLYPEAPVAWRGWQFALLIGIGSLSAAVSVGLVWGDHLRADIERRYGTGTQGRPDQQHPRRTGD